MHMILKLSASESASSRDSHAVHKNFQRNYNHEFDSITWKRHERIEFTRNDSSAREKK